MARTTCVVCRFAFSLHDKSAPPVCRTCTIKVERLLSGGKTPAQIGGNSETIIMAAHEIAIRMK